MAKVTIFLSTLPARGATTPHQMRGGTYAIFLSTLPARGATCPASPVPS